MRKLLGLITVLFLLGCEDGSLALTDKDRAVIKENKIKAGIARQAMFVQCMELAAKMPRKSDDDVADIVEECDLSSYHLTVYMK